jgi:hypothetical protein
MPALSIYTNPLGNGICQVPVVSVGDSTSWTMTFNNGTANYDPGSVSVKLGNIGGLENITYSNAFRFVDRLNMQSVATSFAIASGVPGAITWDVNPPYIEGVNGAYLIRGYRGPSGALLRKIFIISPGTVADTLAVGYVGSTATTMGTITRTDESQKVTAGQVTAPGTGYTSQPTVVFAGGGGGTGAAATAIINGQGFITAVVITAKGSGYSSTPTISFSGGGGSGATATVTRGTANAATSVVVESFTGQGNLSTIPSLGVATAGPVFNATQNTILEGGGIEFNSTCFVRDPVTLEVLTGVQCIPIWNGRVNTAGSPVYDDGLLVIRPRIILSPTFNASGSGPTTVYSGTMDPVTDWVKAVLRYRRSCTVDIEVFGASRLLFLGKLAIVNDAT